MANDPRDVQPWFPTELPAWVYIYLLGVEEWPDGSEAGTRDAAQAFADMGRLLVSAANLGNDGARQTLGSVASMAVRDFTETWSSYVDASGTMPQSVDQYGKVIASLLTYADGIEYAKWSFNLQIAFVVLEWLTALAFAAFTNGGSLAAFASVILPTRRSFIIKIIAEVLEEIGFSATPELITQLVTKPNATDIDWARVGVSAFAGGLGGGLGGGLEQATTLLAKSPIGSAGHRIADFLGTMFGQATSQTGINGLAGAGTWALFDHRPEEFWSYVGDSMRAAPATGLLNGALPKVFPKDVFTVPTSEGQHPLFAQPTGGTSLAIYNDEGMRVGTGQLVHNGTSVAVTYNATSQAFGQPQSSTFALGSGPLYGTNGTHALRWNIDAKGTPTVVTQTRMFNGLTPVHTPTGWMVPGAGSVFSYDGRGALQSAQVIGNGGVQLYQATPVGGWTQIGSMTPGTDGADLTYGDRSGPLATVDLDGGNGVANAGVQGVSVPPADPVAVWRPVGGDTAVTATGDAFVLSRVDADATTTSLVVLPDGRVESYTMAAALPDTTGGGASATTVSSTFPPPIVGAAEVRGPATPAIPLPGPPLGPSPDAVTARLSGGHLVVTVFGGDDAPVLRARTGDPGADPRALAAWMLAAPEVRTALDADTPVSLQGVAGGLPPGRALAVAQQVADALAAATGRRVRVTVPLGDVLGGGGDVPGAGVAADGPAGRHRVAAGVPGGPVAVRTGDGRLAVLPERYTRRTVIGEPPVAPADPGDRPADQSEGRLEIEERAGSEERPESEQRPKSEQRSGSEERSGVVVDRAGSQRVGAATVRPGIAAVRSSTGPSEQPRTEPPPGGTSPGQQPRTGVREAVDELAAYLHQATQPSRTTGVPPVDQGLADLAAALDELVHQLDELPARWQTVSDDLTATMRDEVATLVDLHRTGDVLPTDLVRMAEVTDELRAASGAFGGARPPEPVPGSRTFSHDGLTYQVSWQRQDVFGVLYLQDVRVAVVDGEPSAVPGLRDEPTLAALRAAVVDLRRPGQAVVLLEAGPGQDIVDTIDLLPDQARGLSPEQLLDQMWRERLAIEYARERRADPPDAYSGYLARLDERSGRWPADAAPPEVVEQYRAVADLFGWPDSTGRSPMRRAVDAERRRIEAYRLDQLIELDAMTTTGTRPQSELRDRRAALDRRVAELSARVDQAAAAAERGRPPEELPGPITRVTFDNFEPIWGADRQPVRDSAGNRAVQWVPVEFIVQRTATRDGAAGTTYLTVQIPLDVQPGVPEHQVELVKARAVLGLEKVANLELAGRKPPVGGEPRIQLQIEFVPSIPGDQRRNVALFPGTGRSMQDIWHTTDMANLIAHEVLHWFGVTDDYVDADSQTPGRTVLTKAAAGRVKAARPPDRDRSVMDEHWQVDPVITTARMNQIQQVVRRQAAGLTRDLRYPGYHQAIGTFRFRPFLDATLLGRASDGARAALRALRELAEARRAGSVTGWGSPAVTDEQRRLLDEELPRAVRRAAREVGLMTQRIPEFADGLDFGDSAVVGLLTEPEHSLAGVGEPLRDAENLLATYRAAVDGRGSLTPEQAAEGLRSLRDRIDQLATALHGVRTGLEPLATQSALAVVDRADRVAAQLIGTGDAEVRGLAQDLAAQAARVRDAIDQGTTGEWRWPAVQALSVALHQGLAPARALAGSPRAGNPLTTDPAANGPVGTQAQSPVAAGSATDAAAAPATDAAAAPATRPDPRAVLREQTDLLRRILDRAGLPPSSTEHPAGQPGAAHPESDRPGGAHPVSNQLGLDQSGSDQPGPDQPGPDQPGPDQPGPDQSGRDRPDEPGPPPPAQRAGSAAGGPDGYAAGYRAQVSPRDRVAAELPAALTISASALPWASVAVPPEAPTVVRFTLPGGQTFEVETRPADDPHHAPTRLQILRDGLSSALSGRHPGAVLELGGDVLGSSHLAELLAQRIVAAGVQIFAGRGAVRRVAALAIGAGPDGDRRAADAGRLAALDLAVRRRAELDPDEYAAQVRVWLAELGVLGDQAGAAKRRKELRGWINETSAHREVARQLHAGRATPDAAEVHAALEVTAKRVARRVPGIRGAELDATTGRLRVLTTTTATSSTPNRQIEVPVTVTARTVGPPVRLSSTGPHAYALDVRVDASDQAIAVELAGALAEIGQREAAPVLDPVPPYDRMVDARARARLVELGVQYLTAASKAERTTIVHEVNALAFSQYTDGTVVKAGFLADLDRGLGARNPQTPSPQAQHYTRRIISAAGGSWNTFSVGDASNRRGDEIAASISSQVAGKAFAQGWADVQSEKGSARTQPEPRLGTAEAPRPSRSYATGRPKGIGDNIKKRFPSSIVSAGVGLVILLFGSRNLGKALIGLATSMAGAAGETVMDKLYDFAEKAADAQFSYYRNAEPDTRRNIAARDAYLFLRETRDRLRAGGRLDDATLAALARAEQILADLRVPLNAEVADKIGDMNRRRFVGHTLQRAWDNTLGRLPGIWRSPSAVEPVRRTPTSPPRGSYLLTGRGVPSGRPPLFDNMVRVSLQGVAGALPSLLLGVLTGAVPLTLAAATVAVAVGAGAGILYGLGWTLLNGHQAQDSAAIESYDALVQVDRSLGLIAQIRVLSRGAEVPSTEPEFDPEQPWGARPQDGGRQYQAERSAGRPAEVSWTQHIVYKHLLELVGRTGGLFAASWLTTLVGAGALVGIGTPAFAALFVGVLAVQATRAIGETWMRVAPGYRSRAYQNWRLQLETYGLPDTPDELAAKAVDAVDAADRQSQAMQDAVRRREQEAADVRRESLTEAWRVRDPTTVDGPRALRPGPNDPRGVRLTKADRAEVAWILEHLKQLGIADYPGRHPAALRREVILAELAVALDRAGLLAGQSDYYHGRWRAVRQEARAHGVDLDANPDFVRLRSERAGATAAETEAIRTALAEAADPLRDRLVTALNRLERTGRIGAVHDQVLMISAAAKGELRIDFGRAAFLVQMRTVESGEQAVLRLAPDSLLGALLGIQTGAPHQLVVPSGQLGPDALGRVLTDAVDQLMAYRGSLAVRLARLWRTAGDDIELGARVQQPPLAQARSR
ncbi:hypothetical protein ABGB07_34150 [Micromonosporaceae bacterium B7E4]